MNREALKKAVEKELTRSRWEHTLRVMETAAALSKQWGADPEKAELAALLHDFCKFWPDDRMRSLIVKYRLPEDLLEHNKELWHAPVGAEVVREELGVTNEEVLNAIRYHTSGRPHMSLLEKVIFVADAIEPGRRYPGVEELRSLARQDLDRAVLQSLDNTICFLIERGQKVYPLTLFARNYMVEAVKERTQPKTKEESL
ncbi:hypothetical protein GCM10011571_14560 [Marinithermofilum abyssi]|uniref:bis(5'-nucleosyl)-tetraphosphatase (symmetrical) n=1 Tax=Marinithermofilum abyssi TaxID=1571185 RepID=A0A8J2YD16_9BACL|nr:bis(5'-nucleosyl)-tetraphosphatase (symmetrical) YqeK [Marinithermofilum abyssi]GGE14194.1 hypothetical protein GCM10011571_14560 [Marinithermofilum abyssi]